MNQAYKITNTVNGKSYIGITTQGTKRRWCEHVSRFNLGERDHKLYQAMRKYGIHHFQCEQICSALSRDSLPVLETELIRQYDSFRNGYNMTCEGEMGSKETLAKISAALKGRKITWYAKILEARKQKRLAGHRQTKPKGKDHGLSKKYLVRFPSGEEGIVHGLRQFCRENGLSHNLMFATLNGTQTHHKGFVLLSRFNDQSESSYTRAGGNGAHPAILYRMKIWSDLHGNMQQLPKEKRARPSDPC